MGPIPSSSPSTRRAPSSFGAEIGNDQPRTAGNQGFDGAREVPSGWNHDLLQFVLLVEKAPGRVVVDSGEASTGQAQIGYHGFHQRQRRRLGQLLVKVGNGNLERGGRIRPEIRRKQKRRAENEHAEKREEDP